MYGRRPRPYTQPKAAPPPVCRFWAEGRCLRGAECRYRHSNAFSTENDTPLCRRWISSGFCKFCTECTFRHTGDRFGWRTGLEIAGSSALLSALPDELLAMVVAVLPLRDRLRLRSVCRRLASIVCGAEASLDVAALGRLPTRPALLRSFAERLGGLAVMDLRGCEAALSNPCLLAVAHASPHLEVLRLSSVRDPGMRSRLEVAACISINNAPPCAVESAAEGLAASVASRISAGARCGSRRGPDRGRGPPWPCQDADASNERIASLARSMAFSALREIEIGFIDGMGGEALAALLRAAGGPALRVVCLRGSPSLTDAALSALARSSPGLERLDASFCVRLTDAAAAALAAHCPRLESLAVAWCPCLTDAAPLAFLGHAALRRFDASGVRAVSDASLARLAASKLPPPAPPAPAPGPRGGVDVSRNQGRPRLALGSAQGQGAIANLFDVLFQSLSDIDELLVNYDLGGGGYAGVGLLGYADVGIAFPSDDEAEFEDEDGEDEEDDDDDDSE